MKKVESLADYLGTSVAPRTEINAPQFEDITDAKRFAEAVLGSRDFRLYIVNSLAMGSLSSGVICRLMDYAWGKPVERIEHSGKEGDPIEVITRIVRVVVDPKAKDEQKQDVVH